MWGSDSGDYLCVHDVRDGLARRFQIRRCMAAVCLPRPPHYDHGSRLTPLLQAALGAVFAQQNGWVLDDYLRHKEQERFCSLTGVGHCSTMVNIRYT